jgi:hypothetical protein
LEKVQPMRIKLAKELLNSGFLPRATVCVDTFSTDAEVEEAIQRHSGHDSKEALAQAMLVAGLFPNLASILPLTSSKAPMIRTVEHSRVAFTPSTLLDTSGLHGCALPQLLAPALTCTSLYLTA